MKTAQITILVLTIAILTTLLVGQRFGFTWAGGEGYVTPMLATVIELEGEAGTINVTERLLKPGDELSRGERVETKLDSTLQIKLLETTLELDQNTEIFFRQLNENQIIIEIARGDMSVDSREQLVTTIIRSSAAEVEANGQYFMIGHNHLESFTKVEPLENEVVVTDLSQNKKITTSERMDIYE